MTKVFGNFIGGTWTPPSDAVENTNPSDVTDTVGAFARGGVADVDLAIAAARAAFPAWSRTAPSRRGAVLKATAVALEARREDLARQLSREEGKTLAEALGEVMRAAQIFDFYAGETLRITGDFAD